MPHTILIKLTDKDALLPHYHTCCIPMPRAFFFFHHAQGVRRPAHYDRYALLFSFFLFLSPLSTYTRRYVSLPIFWLTILHQLLAESPSRKQQHGTWLCVWERVWVRVCARERERERAREGESERARERARERERTLDERDSMHVCS